jgi:transposase InsO family protein
VLTDNGGEFRSLDFRTALGELGARHTLIRAGRPQTNGAVEALHRLILEECWRPAFARYLHVRFTGLKRDLEVFVDEYNFDRVHNGRLTTRPHSRRHRLRCQEGEDEMSRKCRHISVTVQFSPTVLRPRGLATTRLVGGRGSASWGRAVAR